MVVMTGKVGSGHEIAKLVVWLVTLKMDVAALLTKSPNNACDLDTLVQAYTKLKNNANLDTLCKVTGVYLEDLLEEQGFFLTWVGEKATMHSNTPRANTPDMVQIPHHQPISPTTWHF
jgi:hypothetical protein